MMWNALIVQNPSAKPKNPFFMVSLGAHMVFIVQIVECEPITIRQTSLLNLMLKGIPWCNRATVVALSRAIDGTHRRDGRAVPIANISNLTVQPIAWRAGQWGALSRLKDAT